MRMAEELKSNIIGILLVIVMILQIAVAIVDSQMNNLADKKDEVRSELIHNYGRFSKNAVTLAKFRETEKFYLEKNLVEVKVKDYPQLYGTLSSSDREKWGEKTVMELLYNDMRPVIKAYNSLLDELYNKETNFIGQIKELNDNIKTINIFEKLLQSINLLILIICVILYMRLLRSINNKILKKESKK